MAQFIQYLYEYENGERVRNLGFMKVEKQMDKTVIQIYAKQIDEVKGIQFQREDGSKYLATWEEGEEEQTPPAQTPPMQRPSVQEAPTQRPPMQTPPVQEAPTQRSPMQTSPIQRPPVQTPPIQMPPMQRPPAQMPRMMDSEDIEEVEEVSAYVLPVSRRYEKIQRQDLSRLPRREWRLANNSFLLHGFYNYHHLLYIEDGDKTWIGVPGIYHEKEKAAANAFGFTEFQRLADMEIELSQEEKNTYDDFGYWCRQVERS